MCGRKKPLAQRGCANKRKTCFYLHGIHFSLGKDFSYWESCGKHMLTEKRRSSEQDSTLDVGDSLQQLSLLIPAGRLCPEGDLTPWVGRSTCCPWDWSTYSL